MRVLPEETLIIEDSPYGLLSAYRSKSNVLRVLNSSDLNYNLIKNKLNDIEKNKIINMPKWKDSKLNVLIFQNLLGRLKQIPYIFLNQ